MSLTGYRSPVKGKAFFQAQGGRQLQNGWKNGSLQALGGESWKLLPPFSFREAVMTELKLTPEQEVEAQRLADIIAEKAKQEALQMARLLVSKQDHELPRCRRV